MVELKKKIQETGEEVYDQSFPKPEKQEVAVIIDKDGDVLSHKYQVVFVDEYNNWWLIGFFNNLQDAEPALNDYLKDYELSDDEMEDDSDSLVPEFGEGKSLGELTEYASTFSTCFDRIISTTCGTVEIRGFVF